MLETQWVEPTLWTTALNKGICHDTQLFVSHKNLTFSSNSTTKILVDFWLLIENRIPVSKMSVLILLFLFCITHQHQGWGHGGWLLFTNGKKRANYFWSFFTYSIQESGIMWDKCFLGTFLHYEFAKFLLLQCNNTVIYNISIFRWSL